MTQSIKFVSADNKKVATLKIDTPDENNLPGAKFKLTTKRLKQVIPYGGITGEPDVRETFYADGAGVVLNANRIVERWLGRGYKVVTTVGMMLNLVEGKALCSFSDGVSNLPKEWVHKDAMSQRVTAIVPTLVPEGSDTPDETVKQFTALDFMVQTADEMNG
jgi:hypothetical protein